MIPETTTLFANESFCYFEQRKLVEIRKYINSLPDEDLLLHEQQEILSWLIDYFFIEPISLNTEHLTKTHEKVKIEHYNNIFCRVCYTEGLKISWRIPYSGDSNLFYICPSHYIMDNFRAILDNNFLIISDAFPIDQLERDSKIPEKKLQQKLDYFQKQISYINDDACKYNQRLTSFIQDIIQERKKTANIITTALQAMNIPLQQNPNAPSIVPLKRKLVKPSMPTAKREQSYCISDNDYLHILGVIRHVGTTFERARKTFYKLKEEELRDIILATLNGHYLGQATSETFRNNGKTDINIEFENRAAFVGECKIWKGEKVFRDTIQQLLSYTTWRDSKNAVIIFNKQNSEFSNIQIQIEPLIKKLDGYKSLVTTKDGEWEFNIEKDGILKLVHVFLFDIYAN